jgi:hypothetical protein
MIPELADDPDWYKTQCLLFDNDQRKIAQELELKFLPTEGSFFEAEIIEQVQEGTIPPKYKLKLYNGEIWKFADPIPERYYIIGVDTAPEHGEDKSAITVWDYETLEQVWEYQGKCKVLDFVKVVQVAATEYPGLIVVESNSYGNQVVESLYHSEFSKMVYQEKRGQKTILPGLSTNAKTRPLMIDALYSYVTQYPNSIKSERLALELTGLVTKPSGKVEAETGCKDDLALATALCFYVRKYDPPLLIGSLQHDLVASELKDIVNFNTGSTKIGSNKEIMDHVKENIDEMGGFVDVLGLYSQE